MYYRNYELTHDTTFGSLKSNDVILPEICSGVHCKVSIQNDKIILEDLSVGDPTGTRILVTRPVELFERDIIILGDLELGVMPISDCPIYSAQWISCAVRIIPLRKSKRTPLLSKEEAMSQTKVFPIPMEGEILIGRGTDCQIICDDVYIYIIYYYLISIKLQRNTRVCIMNQLNRSIILKVW